MKEIFEQTVESIYVNENQSRLFVVTEFPKRVMEFALDAQCCSETWYADIIGLHTLLGEEVIGIEKLELPDPEDGRSRQAFDEVYGYRLTTRKGRTDIVFRNSSNGYYSGRMLPATFHTELPPNLERITDDDWHA